MRAAFRKHLAYPKQSNTLGQLTISFAPLILLLERPTKVAGGGIEMTDNVIPFPVRNPRMEATAVEAGQAIGTSMPVTREEMIQLVLRYAYGAQWAQEPQTSQKRKDD